MEAADVGMAAEEAAWACLENPGRCADEAESTAEAADAAMSNFMAIGNTAIDGFAERAVGVQAAAVSALVAAVAAIVGAAFGGGGRPGNNQDQNKQFDDAIAECERQIGRDLDEDEKNAVHEALHELEDPGFHDIVDECVGIYG